MSYPYGAPQPPPPGGQDPQQGRPSPQGWQARPPQGQWGPPPQAPHWYPPQPPPAPPKQRATNVWALVSVGAGIIGLIAFAIVFGPLAFITGLVGESLARTRGLSGGRLSILGILLGLLCTIIGARAIGVL